MRHHTVRLFNWQISTTICSGKDAFHLFWHQLMSCNCTLSLPTQKQCVPSQWKGRAPKRLSSFQTPATSEVLEPNTLLTEWLQFGDFHDPFWLRSLLERSIELRCDTYSFVIKDTIQEQPKEGTHRARTERVLNAGFCASSPWNQDMSLSQHIDVFPNQEAPTSFSVQLLYWSPIM